ncbi:phosphoenolpyruvate carboxykinase (ATP) [Pseudenhygromyxa sp. WMMC2535]|uniref:phosphoenolpyruvate carboxykinase (ATP) n=1 Tax=Pseudenhygromyxa sp. WMMC2535 TaxID=2712867 RepID=UPI0015562DCF|nr:phosphoenolpyruvate carboxykinase (ATP) [Pseudenhygromyxa sp. WMMC2535]NVB38445.1 phosphoenolpyruvate carboxykinase (ATP) [Pseudenhygromyxa sp. WMMC2535]
MQRPFELPKQPPLPYAVETLANPSQEELQRLALEHTPFCTRTARGSINKVARNKARMAQFTYVIDRRGEPEAYSSKTIDPARAQQLIDGQAAYIAERGKLLLIDGYVGLGPRSVPVQWCYTLEGANIAGMQQVLSFPRERVEGPEAAAEPFEPAFRLVYTPDYAVKDMEGGQAIIVDLDNYVTYIMGPDYFGESKKGALRMLATFLYRQGGLVMHAGAKEITTEGHHLTMGILGLSGTGKTTTTFSKQGASTKPVQDDMIALWPHGEISVTENGCFAKTWALAEENEPVIYRGTVSADAWIENVYLDEQGEPDFFKRGLSPEDVERLRDVLIGTGAPQANVDRYIAGEVERSAVVEDGIPKDGWDFVMWTENGRSIIPMSSIEDAANLDELPDVYSLGILNRDEGPDAATPGLVRFTSAEQAAGYLMLGETSKTSAAGKERGKTRSPFTQPFFPLAHSLQAERFSELAETFHKTTMWLMNTGYIGGDGAAEKAGEALKVKIRHSSAMLEAMLEGSVVWTKDPDFGYEVVDVEDPKNAALLEKVPAEILQPRRFFEKAGRMDEYRAWVASMNSERKAFLEKYAVAEPIITAVVGAA